MASDGRASAPPRSRNMENVCTPIFRHLDTAASHRSRALRVGEDPPPARAVAGSGTIVRVPMLNTVPLAKKSLCFVKIDRASTSLETWRQMVSGEAGDEPRCVGSETPRVQVR